jgi:hypothetical protein
LKRKSGIHIRPDFRIFLDKLHFGRVPLNTRLNSLLVQETKVQPQIRGRVASSSLAALLVSYSAERLPTQWQSIIPKWNNFRHLALSAAGM